MTSVVYCGPYWPPSAHHGVRYHGPGDPMAAWQVEQMAELMRLTPAAQAIARARCQHPGVHMAWRPCAECRLTAAKTAALSQK